MHHFLWLKAHQLCISIILCCGISVCVPAQWQCVMSSAVWCVQCVLCIVECGLWCVQCVVWSWLTASAYSPVSPHRRWADQTLFWVEKILFNERVHWCCGACGLIIIRVKLSFIDIIEVTPCHWHATALALWKHLYSTVNILYSLYSWRPMQWF